MEKGRNHVLTNIIGTYNVQKGKHSNSYRQCIQLLKTQKRPHTDLSTRTEN